MDANQQETVERLIRQIESAFSNVMFDNPPEGLIPVLRQLKNKHWRDIPLDVLNMKDFVYHLPMNKNVDYFLPAYMVAILKYQKSYAYSNDPEGLPIIMLGLLSGRRPRFTDKTPYAVINKKQSFTVLEFLEAYPNLFPDLFVIKTFPDEVKKELTEVHRSMGLSITEHLTYYELWEKAMAFWKSKSAAG
ncbi:MAG: hypothetical protein J0M33_22035 [Anaerolineae bacterium]|nr:hypothetical protein [Anaerolineae bacterium]